MISLGLPLGLTKYVSQWESEGNRKLIKVTVGRLTSLMILISIPISAAAILFAEDISFMILGSESYATFIIIISIAFPFSSIASIFDAYIRGLKIFSAYAKISFLLAISSILISVPCVIIWGLNGVALLSMLTAVLSSFVFAAYLNRNGLLSISDCLADFFTSSKSINLIIKIGLVSLIDLALHQGNTFLMRTIIVQQLGISENGIYQSIFSISNNYLSLFSMTFWVYVLPILSEMKTTSEINNEINLALRFTLLVIFPIISIAFVMREYVLIILYSSQFISAGDYLVYNFIGDFIRALSWVVSAWFIPRGKLWLWLSLGVIFNIVYLALFTILINFVFLDLRSVVIAYAIANLVHFVMALSISRKINGFRFKPDVLKSIVITCCCLSLIFAISTIGVFYGYFAIVPIFVIWLKLCVEKVEVIKFLELIKFNFLVKYIR